MNAYYWTLSAPIGEEILSSRHLMETLSERSKLSIGCSQGTLTRFDSQNGISCNWLSSKHWLNYIITEVTPPPHPMQCPSYMSVSGHKTMKKMTNSKTQFIEEIATFCLLWVLTKSVPGSLISGHSSMCHNFGLAKDFLEYFRKYIFLFYVQIFP